jgi:hypothetical protein
MELRASMQESDALYKETVDRSNSMENEINLLRGQIAAMSNEKKAADHTISELK